MGTVTGGGPDRSRSVVRGLADVRFARMITPRLIGWVYVAGLGLVALGSLAGLLLVLGVAAWLGAGWLVFAPVVIAAGVAGLLLTRVACEWVLMAFTRGRAVGYRAHNGGPSGPQQEGNRDE
ncbi:DUF4282 domain-containing protein [Spirillospora sp. CA-294931]|uniref:DUF4282 domain-containing protein n=1 Tax=Spirillospora sp. CA-294931 TaxID=3240042 RepID=UPI003D8ECAAB